MLLLEIGFDVRVVGLMHHGDIVIAHGIGGEPRVVQDDFIFPFSWPDDDVGNDVGVCAVKEALQRAGSRARMRRIVGRTCCFGRPRARQTAVI